MNNAARKRNIYIHRIPDFGYVKRKNDRWRLVKRVMETRRLYKITYQVHSIEWRAVQDNPSCRAYDKLMQRYHGQKLVLRDSRRDKYGNYHDDYIYEILIS